MDRITDFLQTHEERDGLWALAFDLLSGVPSGNTYSVGAMADSTYEYLLKQWLQSGRTETRYLDMCAYHDLLDAVRRNDFTRTRRQISNPLKLS